VNAFLSINKYRATYLFIRFYYPKPHESQCCCSC